MSKQLNEPITDNGIRNTNFFNGRLLTARDLQTDQQAERSKRWQLGRAIGDGVVEGFEVTLQSPGDRTTLPVVGVKKGLAINRKGQVLSLPNDDEVTLIRRIELPPPEAGVFGDCGLPTSTFTNLDRGVYLFVVGPASTFRERAPMRSVEPNNAVTGCGSKYAVEGVQFDLIKLEFGRMTAVSSATRTQINDLMRLEDAASRSKLRNLLAHLCFGTEELLNLPIEPFKQTSGNADLSTYGAVDFMRSRGEVTDCQVPLALLYWSGSGLAFADLWSVRRRVSPTGTSNQLPTLLDQRRATEGEAVIKQFQQHAEDLRSRETFPDRINASQYFRYLPAAGMLPVRSSRQKGFDVDTFFAGIAHRIPEFMDGGVLRVLFGEAVNYQPIDLTNREMVWLYKVRQNENQPGSPPYFVFASPHVPHRALPRFDVSWWDFGHFQDRPSDAGILEERV